MIVLSYLLAFVGGVVFTVWLCQEDLYHGRKVGYGENDINPDKNINPYNLPSARIDKGVG